MMNHVALHAAGALMVLLVAACLGAAAGVASLVSGPLAPPAAVLAAIGTFQLLRVPVGRTAGRLLDE